MYLKATVLITVVLALALLLIIFASNILENLLEIQPLDKTEFCQFAKSITTVTIVTVQAPLLSVALGYYMLAKRDERKNTQN